MCACVDPFLLCHSIPTIMTDFLVVVDYYYYYYYSTLFSSLDEMPKLKEEGLSTDIGIVCIHLISSKVSWWNYSLQANNPHPYYHGNNKISLPRGSIKTLLFWGSIHESMKRVNMTPLSSVCQCVSWSIILVLKPLKQAVTKERWTFGYNIFLKL